MFNVGIMGDYAIVMVTDTFACAFLSLVTFWNSYHIAWGLEAHTHVETEDVVVNLWS
jgi:hypothetical protein